MQGLFDRANVPRLWFNVINNIKARSRHHAGLYLFAVHAGVQIRDYSSNAGVLNWSLSETALSMPEMLDSRGPVCLLLGSLVLKFLLLAMAGVERQSELPRLNSCLMLSMSNCLRHGLSSTSPPLSKSETAPFQSSYECLCAHSFLHSWFTAYGLLVHNRVL